MPVTEEMGPGCVKTRTLFFKVEFWPRLGETAAKKSSDIIVRARARKKILSRSRGGAFSHSLGHKRHPCVVVWNWKPRGDALRPWLTTRRAPARYRLSWQAAGPDIQSRAENVDRECRAGLAAAITAILGVGRSHINPITIGYPHNGLGG